MDSLLQTILAFINAKGWRESQRIVEEHPELLRAEVDSLMEELARKEEDEGVKERVERLRVLLGRCREVGVGQAFAERRVLADEALQETIFAFITAETWQASQRVVFEHPELLRPEVDVVMQLFVIGQQDERAKRAVEEHRVLLARCREVGIREAFATKSNQPSSASAIPPGFEADIAEAESLMEQMRREPRVIEPLILLYKRILQRLPDEYATLCAAIQNNLGEAYRERRTGDLAANVAQAISCYQQALRFRTPERSPHKYAASQNNLGLAYHSLLTGEREANLKRAIECYQEALRFRTPQSAPLQYAATQNNLGAAYADMLTGDRAENLAWAIKKYQEALRFQTPQTAPLAYALTLDNLGTAYRSLLTGDRSQNLARAYECYQEALRFQSPQTVPLEYAATQNHLGAVYSSLPTGDRAENLAQAIKCYQEALRFWTAEIAPHDYAIAQNNLGLAYADMPIGDRSANLARAIQCFEGALRFRTIESVPVEYAATYSNLGIAYGKLPTGNDEANLRQAIRCYQEALRVYTPEVAPYDYAMTLNNLGGVYANLITGDREANLRRAIEYFEEALRYRTPENAPFEYAMTLSNLGFALAILSTGERLPLVGALPKSERAVEGEENLRRAIAYFEEALRYRTPEVVPFEYAMTQNKLGLAVAHLTTGNRKANVERAIQCYQEALRFRTKDAAPHDCRQTNRNLAHLYFEQAEWASALNGYQAAMNAGEQLYRAGLSAESKASEVAENVILYRNAAFATARLGNTTEALLTLERGKTRLLAEALRLRVSRPADVPDEAWMAFERAGADVRALTGSIAAERNLVQRQQQQRTQAASAALDAAVAQVRHYAPDFLSEIDLSAIQSLIPSQHTALVAFCVTAQGSMVFACSQKLQMIDVPGFTQADLRDLLIEHDADGNPSGGWLVDYIHYLDKRTQTALNQWLATITRTLAELGQQLLAPIIATLPPNIERLILLPFGELFLLPLHAAPLAQGEARLCDRYQVSYAPSAEVLVNIRARATQSKGNDLYAVINPQEDPELLFTPAEGAAIASLFSERDVLMRRAGTKEAVINGVRGRTYLHFSCHGSYNWDNPPASSLILADGHLTLAKLQSGEVDMSAARLVTLSACETGMTDIIKGSPEEYVGLPAGFMLAGVPCVVSSLWAVPELSTALLMERFYRNHLEGGMDFVAALHEAQAWVRDLPIGEVAEYAEKCYREFKWGNKAELFKNMRHYRYRAKQNPNERPFAHPYYWAAFTVNGM